MLALVSMTHYNQHWYSPLYQNDILERGLRRYVVAKATNEMCWNAQYFIKFKTKKQRNKVPNSFFKSQGTSSIFCEKRTKNLHSFHPCSLKFFEQCFGATPRSYEKNEVNFIGVVLQFSLEKALLISPLSPKKTEKKGANQLPLKTKCLIKKVYSIQSTHLCIKYK